MVPKVDKLKNLLKVFIFFPVVFYFGERSYIAYDEGFYALQARWILEKGNWIIPLWWDKYVLDRTIGVQFLIAKSQQMFGDSKFAAYLPTTIASLIMLFITYKLHEELLDKKYALISPLILSTTYLWFDYSHLATQDIIYSCLVTFGVFSLIKIKSKKCNLYIFFFGLWIGLAFMMKTFLVFVPLAALVTYVLTKKDILFTKYFWIGLLIGFLPYALWAHLINPFLDKNIIFYLLEKFNVLANKNNFTNPFYYYFWNIPLSFLPWSIFAIFGLIVNISDNKNKDIKFALAYYPISLIIVLSFFSTKTPYYPLQISSILSLNAYVGIRFLLSSKNYRVFTIFFTSKFIPLLLFLIVSIYLIFLRNTLNLSRKENIFIIGGLIFFGLAWSLIKNKSSIEQVFVTLIIGPYLLTSLVLQSGLFTDRSRELRESMEYLSLLEIPKNQLINVDKSNMGGAEAQSKLIRISLLTPNLGGGISSLKELNRSDFAWSIFSPKETDNSYQIIFDDKNLSPWKLIKKN